MKKVIFFVGMLLMMMGCNSLPDRNAEAIKYGQAGIIGPDKANKEYNTWLKRHMRSYKRNRGF